MKRIYILTIVTLLCGLSAQAQIKPDDPVEKKMAYARFLLNNKINTQLHQKAFDIVRGCAADGYAPAMNALGILYKDGIGTEENKKKAFFWIKKSGECGYPKGYYNLHLLYRFGIGVEQDFDMAQEYLQKAAERLLFAIFLPTRGTSAHHSDRFPRVCAYLRICQSRSRRSQVI